MVVAEGIASIITISLSIVAVTVFYWYYGAFKQPLYASIFEVFSACIPVVMVCGMLPYDISLTLFGSTKIANDIVYQILSILYWVSFILVWVIVPVAVSFMSYSYALSLKHRIWMVIRENLIFYGIVGGLVGLFFLIMVTTGRLSISSIPGIVVALGNGYGLILFCVVFGYAFVQFPAILWYNADPGTKYKRMVNKIFKETKACAVAVADAEVLIEEFDRMKETIKGVDANTYINLGKPRVKQLNLLKSQIPIPDRFYSTVCTNKKILKLKDIEWGNMGFKEIQVEDFFGLMDHTALDLNECIHYIEKVVENANESLAAYEVSIDSWKAKSKTFLKRFGILLLLAWIGVCYYNEIALFFGREEISVYYILSRFKMPTIVGQLLITFPILTFLVFLGGWGLQELRIGSFYRFIPNFTNGNTLSYWGIFLSRLAPTIGYHYMIQIGSTENSFRRVMGVMDEVIFLGKQWNYISPILLLIVSFFVYFNVWDRIKKSCACFGFCTKGAINFSFACKKDLETGEDVLRHLSNEIDNILKKNSKLSVSFLVKRTYKDAESDSDDKRISMI